MKSKFTNIMLIILMIFLLASIAIFAVAMYTTITNLTNVNTSNAMNTINSVLSDFEEQNIKNTTTNINENTINITVENVESYNKIEGNYYFEQLTDTQKKIYEGLQKNKEKMYDGKYTIQYGKMFSEIVETEEGKKKLGDDYQSAVEAFLYDNPDVFYIDANKLFLSIETTTSILKKTHNVYIGPAKNDTYYADGFTSEPQVKVAVKKIEDIRDIVTKRLTGNTYRDILKIHNYLVENIHYDKEYKSIGRYSIYGAFIDKTCVCEGYAKALKYLLNAADIPCVIAQGTATNSSGKSEDHAWNCVYLDGKWYYIDITWNDPIIIGQGSVAKSVHYKYFLKGSKTFNKDHILSYQFSDGGRTYRYPIVEEYDYK